MPVVPGLYPKTAPKWVKMVSFVPFVWGIAGIRMRHVTKCAWTVVQRHHNYNHPLAFSKFLRQAKYCGPLYRHAEARPLKLAILGLFPKIFSQKTDIHLWTQKSM